MSQQPSYRIFVRVQKDRQKCCIEVFFEGEVEQKIEWVRMTVLCKFRQRAVLNTVVFREDRLDDAEFFPLVVEKSDNSRPSQFGPDRIAK